MPLIRRFNGSCALICVLLGLTGCGDSGGGTASGSNSESQSGTSDSDATDATEPTGGMSNSGSSTGDEGGMSDSLSGTTGAEGGMSDSLSGTVSSGVESDSMSGSSATTTMGDGGGETTGTSNAEVGETTGTPVDCLLIDNEADCIAADCMPIIGRKFFIDDADACLELPSFLACAEPAACAEVITTVCKGDPNKNKYQLPNSCAPPDFVPCMAPPDAGMDGYKECN